MSLKRALTLVLGIFTFALALFGFIRNLPAVFPTPRPVDFTAYYVAAAMLNHGQTSDLYDPAAQEQFAQTLGLPGVGNGYLYLPFFAVLLRPLALLDFETASRVWLVLNLIALFVSIHLLLKIADLDSRWRYTLLAFALVLLFPPVVSDLIFGQVNLLLLFLLTTALYLLNKKPDRSLRDGISSQETLSGFIIPQDLFAGILIGIATAIKFYPALVLIPIATARRWSALAGAILAAVLVLIIGLLGDPGAANTLHYLSSGGPQVTISVEPLNQSVIATLKRTFEPHLYRFPVFDLTNYVEIPSAPLLNAPVFVTPLAVLFSLAFILISLLALWRMTKHRTPLRLPFAHFLMLGLLLVPLVWEYYTVLLLIPFAVWFSFRDYRENSLFIIVLATFLLTLHRYWKVLAVNNIPFWLLAFGLAAIVVCWAYTLYLGKSLTESDEQQYGGFHFGVGDRPSRSPKTSKVSRPR